MSNLTQAAAAALNAGMDMNSNTISPSEMGASMGGGGVTTSLWLTPRSHAS